MGIIQRFLIKTETEGKTIQNYELPITNCFDLCLGKTGCLRYLFPRKPKLQKIFCRFKRFLVGTF